jgi:hypothetical protein
MSGEQVHLLVYELAKSFPDERPAQLFQAVYVALLGKPKGPRAGTFIALDDLLLEGVVTNVAIHKALLASETFLEGKMTTNLLDRVGGAAILAAAARV